MTAKVMSMAHDNEITPSTPVILFAEVPAALAQLLLAKPQFLFSERMYDHLQAILVDEQQEYLDAHAVEARPIIFKGAMVVPQP